MNMDETEEQNKCSTKNRQIGEIGETGDRETADYQPNQDVREPAHINRNGCHVDIRFANANQSCKE